MKEARKAAESKNSRVKKGRLPIPIPAKLGQVRANREKALFSHIWNYARSSGFTKLANPCTGVKGYTEEGRDVMVDDELLSRTMARAGEPLRFALRLAHLTGQRPADVLRMSEAHITAGMLHVRRAATAEVIVGFAQLLKRRGVSDAEFKEMLRRPEDPTGRPSVDGSRRNLAARIGDSLKGRA